MTDSPDFSAQLGIKDEITTLKRERTIAAAAELFYEHGYENTTLDAVAERLGVTKPFIYAHFDSKAELLAEICCHGINLSLDAINHAASTKTTPTEKLRQLAHNFATSVLENQKLIAIFSREEKNLDPRDYRRLSNMRREFDRKLVALLEEGVKSGEFQLTDPPVAALAICGLVSWTYVWYRPHGRMSMSALADQLTGLIVNMVAAKRGKSSGSGRAA